MRPSSRPGARNGPALQAEAPHPSSSVPGPGPAPAETATGPVSGYVASRSATGTKTDTPLIETPQAISVVTKDQIEAQAAQSVKQALRYTSGVMSESRANFGGFDILYSRGFALDRYLNGMRLQGDNAFVASQPDIYSLERIDVLKGPASVLFGQGSPGGIANLVSKRPTETPFREIFLQGGNYGRIQGGFDLSGAATPDGTLLYRVTGAARDADNQVRFVKEQRYFIQPSFTYRPDGDTSWTVLLNYQRDPNLGYYNFVPYRGTLGFNQGGVIPTKFYSGEPLFNSLNRTQYGATSIFEHRFNDHLTFRQSVQFMDTSGNFNQVLPLDQTDDGSTLFRYGQGVRDRIASFSSDSQLEAKFETGPLAHKLLVGLDTQNTLFTERFAQNNLFLNGTGPSDLLIFSPIYGAPFPNPLQDPTAFTQTNTHQRLQQIGTYAQDQITFGGLHILGGARWDTASSRTFENLALSNTHALDHATTGRVGAIYVFESGLAPYATYATSFSPQAGVDASSHPFKPTTGELVEAGLKYQPPGFKTLFQFAAFDLTQQNVLTPDVNNPGFRTQTGEIRSRGLEFEVKATVAKNFDLVANYTILDPKVTRSNNADIGKVPIYIPRQTAGVWADYTFSEGALKGFGFGAGIRYIGRTYADLANTVTVPAYTLVDAAIHYDLAGLSPYLKGAKFSVNATNLFDKRYVSQCTDIGPFFGSYDSIRCVYGLRRQVFATLQYRW